MLCAYAEQISGKQAFASEDSDECFGADEVTAMMQYAQKMFDNGVITGSSYHVQPRALGYQLCVYIGIKMEKASMYNQVIAALEQIPEIVEAQYTLGEFGLLIKVYAHDNEHLLSLLNTKIQIIPGVADTTTLTTLAQPIYRQLPIII